jgi:hypothetical protein
MWMRVTLNETDADISVEPKSEYVGQRGGYVVRLGSNTKIDLTYPQARELFLSLQDALTLGAEE